ncbi:MAG TPA: class I SAM-dependent methyltransferase [Iamia sp.]|jgi:SAM-dependent methyltransferase|nr:class I SAM-dependent methyltransferase [Iamia sp.]
MARTEEDLLAELNADLREGVDWKQGAITYLREIVASGGQDEERFHLVKPFVGGPDYAPFWVDVFQFLDVVQAAKLAPGDLVVDVGCGPGWTVQWLAKLGHNVVGLDISAELLEVAETRMQTDPYPPYVHQGFTYDLREHDIEAAPVGLRWPARLALFESTLHHFFNPVAALRNTVADLADDGIVAVIEAAAPPKGSEWDLMNIEIMEKYDTIERPYTRTQLLDMLELAGLPYVSFLRPVNGLYPQTHDGLAPLLWELTRADNINIFLASPTAAGIERLGLPGVTVSRARDGWTLVSGVSAAEDRPDGTRFRWAEPKVLVRLDGAGPHDLRVATVGLEPGQVQRVRVIAGGKVAGSVALTAERGQGVLELSGRPGQVLELQSDRVFSPAWDGASDARLLSYTIDEPA